MKKLILAFSLLMIWAGNATAKDTKTIEGKQQFNEQSILVSTPATTTMTLLLDENIRLREDADMLNKKMDELSNKLDYTQMMHTSLSTLQQVASSETVEEANCKIAYMQMMHVTLMNLNKIVEAAK